MSMRAGVHPGSMLARPFAVLALVVAVAAVVLTAGCGGPAVQEDPPETRTVDAADTLHGVVVPDPYRWLEDFESDEAQTWIGEQNAYTENVIGAFPDREQIRARLDDLFQIPNLGYMWERSDRLFFLRRDPENEQQVLYVQRGVDAEPTKLIDPEDWTEDTPVDLDWWFPTSDGELLAFGLSESGSEESTLRVMDVDSKELLPDLIPYTRAASLAWREDKTGFYYSRFPAPGEVPDDEIYYHRKVYYHEMGTDPSGDPLVFGEDLEMEVWTGISLSTNGRFLIGYAWRGTVNDLYLKDLAAGSGWRPLIVGLTARSSGVAIGNEFFMLTEHDAPNGRLFRVDLTRPGREHWVEIVPESQHSIESFLYVSDRLFVRYLEDAKSKISVFDRNGKHLTDIDLPDMATVFDWTGDWEGDDVFIAISSYLLPPRFLRYELETGELETHLAVEAPIDTEPYVTEQVWFTSKDGTKVPMFLVHRKEIQLDGSNPTVLTGYGGFTSSMQPSFARNRYLWLDHGGVWAEPNIRGGGEYGEEWHRDGMLANKQNSFDDFIAAAEWLVENGYTSPERLAVWGGSNGGLLVGAFATQRPDLAGTVICDVPLLDMVRFHKFYAARIWTPEYGSPEVPEEFEWLFAYSPYHHIVDGTEYPAILFTTAESDSRVHPSHAMKATARLQAASASDRPILLFFEREAGHGMGLQMSTILDQYVDYYSFLFQQMGMRYQDVR
jgi:prolyl oligopeptidase